MAHHITTVVPQHDLVLNLGGGDPTRARKVMMALAAFLLDKPENTRRSYQTSIKQFFDRIGWKPPEEVSVAEAVAFKRSMIVMGKSRSTICTRIAALDSFFDFLLKPTDASGETLIKANPFDAVSLKDVAPTPYANSRPVSSVDGGKMIDMTPTTTPIGRRDRAVLIFLAYTGRRRAEVANMRVGDLDLLSKPRTYKVRVKGGAEQKFELPDVCYEAIKAHWISADRLKKITPRSAVFAPIDSVEGSPLTKSVNSERTLSAASIGFITKRAAKRAGLDWTQVHAHGFRHMVARDLDDGGARLQEIQRFLGHLTPNTTSRYLGQLRAPVASQEKMLDAIRAKARADAEAVASAA